VAYGQATFADAMATRRAGDVGIAVDVCRRMATKADK